MQEFIAVTADQHARPVLILFLVVIIPDFLLKGNIFAGNTGKLFNNVLNRSITL